MTRRTCEDCGTGLWGDACPNCQEELCIVTHQSDAIEVPLSPEFLKQVEEQRALLDRRADAAPPRVVRVPEAPE